MIVQVIKYLVGFYKNNYFKVIGISHSQINHEYVVTFFSLRTRVPIVKTAYEIMEDQEMLNRFDPLDAAEIGRYVALSHYTRIAKANGVKPRVPDKI